MNEFLQLSLMAEGLAKAWIICAGTNAGNDMILRPAEDGLKETGKTFSGCRIISRGSGLREYSVSFSGNRSDACCLQQLLIAQDNAPGTIQFLDEIEMIPVSKVVAPRTAHGTVDDTGAIDKTFFKGFAIIENATTQEYPYGHSAGECRYLIEFTLKEI